MTHCTRGSSEVMSVSVEFTSLSVQRESGDCLWM